MGQEKKELEKVMMDYVRWVYRLDFSIPRYIIRKELGIDKLKLSLGMI